MPIYGKVKSRQHERKLRKSIEHWTNDSIFNSLFVRRDTLSLLPFQRHFVASGVSHAFSFPIDYFDTSFVD